MNALQEHAAYSSHYLWGGEQRRPESDDDNGIKCPNRKISIKIIQLLLFLITVTKAKPLGCMSDALASASASFEVLQRQLGDCTNNVEQLQQNMTLSKSSADSPTVPASLTTLMVRNIEMSYLVNFYFPFSIILYVHIRILIPNQFFQISLLKFP